MSSRKPTSWLLQSKLTPPSMSERAVARAHLLDKLTAERKCRVSIICAPAGYGKTTLLTQAYERLQEEGRRAAWLTLDPFDKDPRQLLVHLSASLRQAGLPIAEISELNTGDVSGKTIYYFTGLIFDAIIKDNSDYHLILDDYHEIGCKKVDDFFDYFLKSAPRNLKFIISSRTRPNLSLSRFFVRGELQEFSTKDLRFSHNEAAEYFAGSLSDNDLGAIINKVEGWPAALRLFQLTWQANGNVGGIAAGFTGTSAECADYLSEQVFLNTPRELQDFLLLSSVPERISGDLMNYLTGRDDGWRNIEELERRNLLISAIDADRQWFRYHRLFKDFLLGRLTRSSQEIIVDLHRKSAQWFAEKQALREAVYHARQAGNPTLALEIIEKHGGWRIAVRGEGVIFSQLAEIPSALCEPFVRTRLGQIYAMMQSGELSAAAAMCKNLRHSLQRSDAPTMIPHIRAEVCLMEYVMNVYEDRPFTVEEVQAVEDQFESLSMIDDQTRILIGILFSFSAFSAGDYERSLHAGLKVHPLAKFDETAYLRNYITMYLGLSSFALGRLDDAARYYQSIISFLQGRSINFSGQIAAAKILLAEVLYERGNLPQASSLISEAMPVLEHFSGWFDLFEAAYGTLASIAARGGDLASTLSYLEEKDAGRSALGRDRLHTLIGIISARELLRAGDIAAAETLLQRADIQALISDEALRTPADPRLYVRALMALARHSIQRRDFKTAQIYCQALEKATGQTARKKYLVARHMLTAATRLGVGDFAAALEEAARAAEISKKHGLLQSLADEADLIQSAIMAHGAAPAMVIKQMAAVLGMPEDDHRAATVKDAPSMAHVMTEREREIVDLISSGCTSKEIARALGMSINTVLWHRKNLYRKLAVSTRSQLIRRMRDKNTALHIQA